MSGKEIRLEKLFSKGENAIVIAVDHGLANGPYKGLENLPEAFGKFYPYVDGVLLSPGILKNVKHMFNYKGAPIPIARITINSSYFFDWGYDKSYINSIFSVKDAVALGAEIAMFTLAINTGSEKTDVENMEIFAKLCNECREYGIPAIGECYPSHCDNMPEEEMHDIVYRSTRIMAELGADAVKTFYSHRIEEVVDGCPLPILGLGGSLTNDPLESLILAQKMIRGGYKGVVFGRNAFQRPDPAAYQQALCEVVKHAADPCEMVEKFKLK